MPQSQRFRFVRPLAWSLCAGFSLLGAAVAQADEWCVLSLKDGRTLSGILVEQNEAQVTIRPDGGANTTFSRAEIAGVRFEKSAREAYAEARAATKGDDVGKRYELLLAFYYKNEKNLPLVQFAKTEADQLAQDFPDSAQIKRLVRVIADRLAKKDDPAETPAVPAVPKAEPKTEPKTATGPDAGTAKDPKAEPKKDEELLPAAPAVGLLSAADQNLLRIYQLNFAIQKGRPAGADKAAKVVFPKEAIETLFKDHADAEELARYKGNLGMTQFRALSPLEQLDVLFAVKARALYAKVEVKTEPAALAEFRNVHHRHVVAHFSNHFAGLVAGLIAKPKIPTDQTAAYTNFLALNLAVIDGHPVINRDKPEESLLLQWGLPRNEAKFPAPNVKGWKPCFSSPRDSRFKALAKWIETTSATEGMTLPAAPAVPAAAGQKQP